MRQDCPTDAVAASRARADHRQLRTGRTRDHNTLAGTPLRRFKRAACQAEIERLAAESEMTPLEWVLNFTEQGHTFTALSEGLTRATKVEVSRKVVREYIESLAPDAAAQVERARVQGGRALLDQTIPIADSATPDDHQVAKLRIETRRYVAGVFDPSTRENKGMNVSISIGAMHLDALRHINAEASAVISPGPDVQSIPSQVVEAIEVSSG